MLGEFISRALLMILGYAYPAFECFKTVERNRVDIHELRFWCQYWIIIAVLSVCERFGDFFVSWVPMYGEMKLAFIIYLWYPKTKGTSYVYESILRPLVSKHETDIDKQLKELRLRAWDLAIYYYQNCTDLGQSAFFNVIQYVANQSTRLKGSSSSSSPQNGDHKQEHHHHRRHSSPLPPPPTKSGIWPLRRRKSSESPDSSPRHPNSRWPPPPADQPAPSAPPMPATFPSLFKHQANPTKSNLIQVRLDQPQTEFAHVHEFPTSPTEVNKSKLGSGRFNFMRY